MSVTTVPGIESIHYVLPRQDWLVAPNGTTICYCRKKISGKDGFLIGCVNCRELYHGKCVSISYPAAVFLLEKKTPWFCLACLKRLDTNELRKDGLVVGDGNHDEHPRLELEVADKKKFDQLITEKKTGWLSQLSQPFSFSYLWIRKRVTTIWTCWKLNIYFNKCTFLGCHNKSSMFRLAITT